MKISKLVPAIGICAICVSFGSVQASDNTAQAAARAALMKQMDQVQAPVAQTPSPAPTAPAAPAATSTVVVQPVSTASGVSDTAAQEKARAALLASMAATSPQQPMTSQPMTSALASPVPIVAPAIPISATKEQRLHALLAQYKADQITPEEYHKQRAAILAAP